MNFFEPIIHGDERDYFAGNLSADFSYFISQFMVTWNEKIKVINFENNYR